MKNRGAAGGTAWAAKKLGKSQRWIQRAVAAGDLPAYRLGDRDITLYESDLEEFIEARRVQVGGAA